MKLRIILLFVAIIIGAVAVFGVLAYVSSIRTSVEYEVAKVEVLVAASNIPKETPVEGIIASESVTMQAIPRKYLADGVLTSLEDYKDFVTAAPINKGEQITSTKFIKPEDIGLAFSIPKDKIAISIPINEVIGVSNLINVGDHVNIIATFKLTMQGTAAFPPGTEEAVETTIAFQKEITKTLLWNVEVLHIGTGVITAEEQAKGANITTITLAVTPEESEIMVFTEEMGNVWLALLPTTGYEKEETIGRTYDNIFE